MENEDEDEREKEWRETETEEGRRGVSGLTCGRRRRCVVAGSLPERRARVGENGSRVRGKRRRWLGFGE